MGIQIITNNPQVVKKYGHLFTVHYYESVGYFEIMGIIRDWVHMGHKLLIHPLYGNLKPFETPYRSIAFGKKEVEESSLILMEQIMEQIQMLDKEPLKRIHDPLYLEDYQLMDFNLFENALGNISKGN